MFVLIGVLFLSVFSVYAETADRYILLGVTNAKQGNLNRAILGFTKAIEINPNLAEACSNKTSIQSERSKCIICKKMKA